MISQNIALFPANGSVGVNPDTHLVITFTSAPAVGTGGQIRIYNAADGRLVNRLDLSIPVGPTANYQWLKDGAAIPGATGAEF